MLLFVDRRPEGDDQEDKKRSETEGRKWSQEDALVREHLQKFDVEVLLWHKLINMDASNICFVRESALRKSCFTNCSCRF